jgi:glucokinase
VRGKPQCSEGAVPVTKEQGVTVAVDVGGTNLKGAIFRASGAVVSRRTVSTSAHEDVLSGLTGLVRSLIADARSKTFRSLQIGIASPGIVDSANGSVTYAANLNWSDLQLADTMSEMFGVPTTVEHDARAGAIAERAAHPQDPRFDNFIFIPIGTGVAAAVVTGGSMTYGHTGAAGEFGHMPVVRDGDPCGCGQRGCLEAYASAGGILRRYTTLGGSEASSTAEILERIETDAVARRVWEDALDALAVGVASLSALLDPAVVVLGGGLSSAGRLLLDPLTARVGKSLRWRDPPPLTISELGSLGGLIGAALLGAPPSQHDVTFVGTAVESLKTSGDAGLASASTPASTEWRNDDE